MKSPAALARAERLAQEKPREIAVATGFFSGTVSSWREIWSHRELLALLTRREVRARYKDSALGLTWSLARPLMQLAIYWIAIGQFLGASRHIAYFHIYVFAGLTLWQFFTEVVSGGTTSIVSNSGIIRKIHLPREIFPLSAVGSAGFNFLMQLLILILATLLIGPGIAWGVAWYLLPLSILTVLVWGTALALFLGAANVYMRDVQYLVEVVLMAGFWLSPIVYSWQMVSEVVPGWLGAIYLANPVTLAALSLQRAVWPVPDQLYPADLSLRMMVASAVGLVLLFLAQRAFDRMQRDFAQEV